VNNKTLSDKIKQNYKQSPLYKPVVNFGARIITRTLSYLKVFCDKLRHKESALTEDRLNDLNFTCSEERRNKSDMIETFKCLNLNSNYDVNANIYIWIRWRWQRMTVLEEKISRSDIWKSMLSNRLADRWNSPSESKCYLCYIKWIQNLHSNFCYTGSKEYIIPRKCHP